MRVRKGVKACWAEIRVLPARLFRKNGDSGAARRSALGLLCLLAGAAFLLSALFPSTFLRYGTLWMVFGYLFAIVGLLSDRDANTLPFYMALMLLFVYVLGVKIHERYLFAALLLLPLGYVRVNAPERSMKARALFSANAVANWAAPASPIPLPVCHFSIWQ